MPHGGQIVVPSDSQSLDISTQTQQLDLAHGPVPLSDVTYGFIALTHSQIMTRLQHPPLSLSVVTQQAFITDYVAILNLAPSLSGLSLVQGQSQEGSNVLEPLPILLSVAFPTAALSTMMEVSQQPQQQNPIATTMVVFAEEKGNKSRLNLCSFNMKNPIPDHVIGIPVSSVSYTVEDSAGRTTSLSETANSYFISTPSKESTISKQNRVKTSIEWINKVGKKADNFRQHVRLGSKVSATVKGKLRLGARILQEGGLEKLFKQIFNVGAEEKLLNAFQCYLSTTAGPVAGLLFISTERLAFCSERPLTFTLPTGKLFRTPYKVMIPLKKIKVANQSENVNKPSQKYIQVVTVDKFEFWFMGFLKYQKAFKYIQQSISQS
ncbi:hypothetical protein NE237_006997 [Protea cynaroides]|uniref:GRAM domain-containing protein n=1 Tax=Protea cynaroides TaxID=273540 RepID=A0A9Q0KNH5_9MAGN|nr:hypothetical protein NE237_006997 [Protea cynaroides]